MSLFVVDVEADGPIPHKYSMVSFGAVLVDQKLDQTFYGKIKPVSEEWIPDALAVSGHTREETMGFNPPEVVMKAFVEWVNRVSVGRPVFVSDNNGFDWQFVNFYLWMYAGENPFGFSSRRIGDFYAGLQRDYYAASKWKHLRKTKHTHNPVDDCIGNAEALLTMFDIMRKMKNASS